MKNFSYALIMLAMISSCSQPKEVDLIIYNAKIYTVDSAFSVQSAMAISNGKVESVDNDKAILSRYFSSKIINMNGGFVYPGFIDAHSHFVGYAEGLVSRADLVGTASFEEVLLRLQEFENQFPSQWLVGRGWDQNDWEKQEFPTKERLDELWPNKPVYLSRVDGHAALLNSKALQIAGITAETEILGGEIILWNKEPNGILIDNAMEIARIHIPEIAESIKRKGLLEAERNCFSKGLTSVCDAGLEYADIQFLDVLQKEGALNMKVYAMLAPTAENIEKMMLKGPYKTDKLNVRSVKLYADGALGSRGACLIHQYQDKPKWRGMMMNTAAYYDSLCSLAYEYGFQVNTHAIGDSANRSMLHIYSKYLRGANDKRWRIEHSQFVDPTDFALFGQYHIIPSVQPTHATSDMYWAKERLGEKRIKSAYAYKDLLKQNDWLPLGTDFPVEKIDPLLTFYAAVARKDLNGFPEQGFQMENALSREEALRGITIWAAKAAFEEDEKGSLETGKCADFVVLNQDIMEVSSAQIPNTQVRFTYMNGKQLWQR